MDKITVVSVTTKVPNPVFKSFLVRFAQAYHESLLYLENLDRGNIVACVNGELPIDNYQWVNPENRRAAEMLCKIRDTLTEVYETEPFVNSRVVEIEGMFTKIFDLL